MKPLVSFIIPTLNEGKHIDECLKSIANSNYPIDRIEVILVDSGSIDETINIAKQYGVKVFVNKQANKPEARNKGLLEAHGEYVFPFNAHATIEPNTINILLSKFQGDIQGVGCHIDTPNKEQFGRTLDRLLNGFIVGGRSNLFNQYSVKGDESLVHHLPFVLYKKKVFETIGGYDETLQYGQDAELNYRLTKTYGDVILYTPNTTIYLYKPSNLSSLVCKMMDYGCARSRIIKKHPDVMSPLHLFVLIALPLLFFYLMFSAFIPILSTIFYIGVIFYLGMCFISGFQIEKNLGDTLIGLIVYPLIHYSYSFGMFIGWITGGKKWIRKKT